ncbi:hypothetical protein LL037_12910 [Clostridium estertheticum]|uniref:hypothetical protein n=1 Tax=Clostridium estertheticum TaxID=238834 RepID=UPI001C0DC018|nr:hypothetical protein [Clostridium estertheticum]MBU3200972.1 hypothetical protein [Clostridium estertheticum]WAG63394.1 hypothetical protein LL037_12910 [Clostridium estertheticum]
MDNDTSFKKVLIKLYKYLTFNMTYSNLSIYNDYDGNELIKKCLLDDKPLLVSRFGANESRCINYYIKDKKYDEFIKDRISVSAGVYPTTKENLDRFCEYYIKCSRTIDILALWKVKGEKNHVKKYCKDAKFTKLVALEPYYFKNPWSEALENKKILIIHPFEKTIQSQYRHREFLFKDSRILPKFKSIEVIKAVQSLAQEQTPYKNWFEAYESMCKIIDTKDFDIAIIGAGAYGLPLAYYVKSIGKKAIHLAGATQILFGIKGKRWDKHDFISKLYNEYWVRPSEDETPQNSIKVEGGSYW